MLVNYLMSHSDVCCHAEVFGPKVVEYYGLFIKRTPSAMDLLFEFRARDPIGFLNNFVFYAGKRKAVGFKFKFEELSLPQYTDLVEHIRRDTAIKIIYLTRKNLLKRYVSQHLAVHVHKRFNVHKGNPLPPAVTTRLSASECESEFEFTNRREKKFHAFFSKHLMLEITYEDLVDNSEETLAKVQDFLGVERLELKTKLVKIQHRPMSEVLENYDEMKAYFADTDYAVFFDDIVR